MVTRTCKSARTVLHGVLASVLALLAFAMCAPQLAFADETTQAINGTMTITLQDGGASGAVAGAGASTVGKASSGTATGDALMWLILGVVVLIAGAVYVFIKSRHLATNTGAHANVNTSSKKKTIIVAVVTALIACTCFGMFASKGVAFANKGTAVTNDTFSSVFGSSAVEVDSDGNVLSNSITVVNDEDEAIIVKSVEAPSALSSWNADIANKTIESGAVAEGEWYASTIPASLLEQLKNNDGYAELTFTMNVDDAKTPLDFDKFEVTVTPVEYTGEQIKPEVAVSGDYKLGTDYEVIYGENTNAGIGTVTIKGIGDYKGEKTFTFTIEPSSIESKTVTISEEGTTYTGGQLTPKITIEGLVEGTDFEVAYGENKNAGTDAGMVTVIGKGNYTSSQTKTFDIQPASINSKTVTISKEGTTYTGSQLKPTVSIEGLVENTDFTVSYGDNVSAGSNKGSVTVSGIGNYTDSHILNFDIAKATPTVVEPTGVTAEVGQTLAEVSIPAQVAPNVPGTFAWEGDTSIKFDTVGQTYTGTAKFTPTDTANYEEVAGISVTLTVTEKKSVYAVYDSDDYSLNFYNRVKPSSDESASNGSRVVEEYEGFDAKTYTSEEQVPWYSNQSEIKTINVVDEGIQPESTAYWFSSCESLTRVDGLSKLDTSKTTTMRSMFYYCMNLTALNGMEDWNTSEVTDMNGLFQDCWSLATIDDVSKWNVSSVTDMGWLFNGCSNLTKLDVSSWNVSSVIDMGHMFSYCRSLSSVGDLTAWNTRTSKVKDMCGMFYKCSSLTADCSGWNVGNVTDYRIFSDYAKDIKEPNWPNQVATTSVASSNSLSAPVTVSVVAGEKSSTVSTASDNTSAVAQNADGNSTINSEETVTTEADSTEGANEVAGEVSSTAESDAILQEVNCLSALSKENSSEAEMKAVA